MYWLKQSTSTVVQFGPFVDVGDGVTPETGLATNMNSATTGIRISKAGAVFAARGTATLPVHNEFGYYRTTLSTADTDTLGRLRMIFSETATTLPVWMDFMVVSAEVWDMLFGSGGLTTAMSASVNAQVLDVLNVDTFGEPGQETPLATTSIQAKIGYLYKILRNRKTSTATTISIYNDDATTVDHKRTISDDGTTYDETEIVSGP